MGFECGFIKIKRCGDITFKEYDIINSYITYQKESWAKEHFDTFEKYYAYLTGSDKVDDTAIEKIEINQDYVDFYKNNPEETLTFWCSIGRYLDNYIIEHLELYSGIPDYYIITEQFIKEALNWVTDYLQENRLIPVSVIKSWRKDEDSGNEIMNPCDGLIVEDDLGDKLVVDLDEEGSIWIAPRGYQDDQYHAMISFRDALVKMLKDFDPDKEFIVYFRSY